jgi:hypothetical protein
MTQYLYFQAQILTDSVFLQYGGMTGTSTQAQRNAAYLLSEEQMTEHLSAFLVPTIITGSVSWRGSLFEAEFGYIQRILLASVTAVRQLSPLETQIYTGSALIRNSDYGYVDIVVSNNAYGIIYSATLVYESGLATGTVTSPTFLAALTMAAQINLNEWDVSLSNEGTADVGIQAYSNQSYSEQRKYLGRTVFGDSPMAQRVARMTRKYRAKPTTGFR